MNPPGVPAVSPPATTAGCALPQGSRGVATLRRALTREIAASALALFALVPSGLPQTIRVTTWDLDPPRMAGINSAAVNTSRISIPAAAAALRNLDADVILLQQVRDWRMCDQLAEALQPAKYNVVTCSAFRDAQTGALRKQQVAILARSNAYFCWSETWRNQDRAALPGGFAFAALRSATSASASSRSWPEPPLRAPPQKTKVSPASRNRWPRRSNSCSRRFVQSLTGWPTGRRFLWSAARSA